MLSKPNQPKTYTYERNQADDRRNIVSGVYSHFIRMQRQKLGRNRSRRRAENHDRHAAGATGSEQNVSFGATVDWTAALTDPKAAEWCAVTPTRGKAGSELKLTVRSLRTMTRTASGRPKSSSRPGTASGKVTVTQVKQGVLAVNPARFDVPGIGATIDATVQQNVEYSVVIPDSVASWILPADGLESGR